MGAQHPLVAPVADSHNRWAANPPSRVGGRQPCSASHTVLHDVHRKSARLRCGDIPISDVTTAAPGCGRSQAPAEADRGDFVTRSRSISDDDHLHPPFACTTSQSSLLPHRFPDAIITESAQDSRSVWHSDAVSPHCGSRRPGRRSSLRLIRRLLQLRFGGHIVL